MDIKTITIPAKKSTKKNKVDYLSDQRELKYNCLKYFYGCWIKCVDKNTGKYFSGGFLTRVCSDVIFLRSIQSPDLIEFSIKDHRFYSKQDSEHYLAMQEIERKKEELNVMKKNLKLETKEFNIKNKNFEIERDKFLKIKYKFLKLFQNGKVKIT